MRLRDNHAANFSGNAVSSGSDFNAPPENSSRAGQDDLPKPHFAANSGKSRRIPITRWDTEEAVIPVKIVSEVVSSLHQVGLMPGDSVPIHASRERVAQRNETAVVLHYSSLRDAVMYRREHSSILDYVLNHERYLKAAWAGCVFCEPADELIVDESENFLILLDPFPLCDGHLLVASKDHLGCLGEVPDSALKETTKSSRGPSSYFSEKVPKP